MLYTNLKKKTCNTPELKKKSKSNILCTLCNFGRALIFGILIGTEEEIT